MKQDPGGARHAFPLLKNSTVTKCDLLWPGLISDGHILGAIFTHPGVYETGGNSAVADGEQSLYLSFSRREAASSDD